MCISNKQNHTVIFIFFKCAVIADSSQMNVGKPVKNESEVYFFFSLQLHWQPCILLAVTPTSVARHSDLERNNPLTLEFLRGAPLPRLTRCGDQTSLPLCRSLPSLHMKSTEGAPFQKHVPLPQEKAAREKSTQRREAEFVASVKPQEWKAAIREAG